MPDLRLSAGRTVQPIERPLIAAVRGLELAAPGLEDLPPEAALPLAADNGGAALGDLPLKAQIEDAGPGALIPPSLHALPAVLPAAEPADPGFEAFDAPEVEGGRFPARAADDPPALPRAYQPQWVDGQGLVARPYGPLPWLHAQVEPGPSLDPAVVLFGEPRALREDQMQAVAALLEHERFLLADHPGTGKTVAACVALQHLVQEGSVRRALIVCAEGMLRHWARHLREWAPGLLVTAVGGEPRLRDLDWRAPAHVYLVEAPTVAEDLDGGRFAGAAAGLDLVALDGLPSLRPRPGRPAPALEQVPSVRRWALADAFPATTPDWRALFNFLFPEHARLGADLTLPDFERRLRSISLRRTRADLGERLARESRTRLWLDLDAEHQAAYLAALAEERHRLADLGAAVTRTHLDSALARLKQLCNFVPETLDGAKIRALVGIVEGVAAAGEKLVVLSQFTRGGLDELGRALEVYGAVRAGPDDHEEARAEAVTRFRDDPARAVLLSHPDIALAGGPLVEAGTVVHFDLAWNPAVGRRAERRLHPDPGPFVGTQILELWAAATVDESLFRALAARGLLPEGLPPDARPSQYEDAFTPEAWLEQVFEIPRGPAPVAAPVILVPGSRKLPPAGVQREQLEALAPDQLLEAVAQLMRALGFLESEVRRDPSEGGGELIAWRPVEAGRERVLVRGVRQPKDVGVGEARALMAELDALPECSGAYLISTTDFTASCKRLADGSGGRLTLVSGAEFYRHLHILGAI